MDDQALDMLKAETAFLAGVEGKLEAAKGKHLQGSIWRTTRQDGSDRLRELMARHRVYDRQRLKDLPQNRTVAVHGFRRRWLLGRQPTGVAIASVLCPMEHVVAPASDRPPTIGLGELRDHVRRLVGEAKVPHVIGVCAPGGFSADARGAKLDVPHVTLVLIEPRPGGGWSVTSTEDELPEHVLSLFDPEEDHGRIDRVRRELQQRSADLLTGGLSAATVAGQMGVPEKVVVAAMEQAARADAELKLVKKSDGVLLFRGAPVARATEKAPMGVVERIRQMFAREGNEAAKINLLAERRAGLSLRRDRIYEDIAKLEGKEADLFRQGREATSLVVRRRLAAQLAQLRKDIGRQNTTTNMLNQQINIISTDIHNLTLIQQGAMAQLPDTEQLTENAVKAEELLESLKIDAELVAGLETGLSEVSTSSEELDILKEFEAAPVVREVSPVTARVDPVKAESAAKSERGRPDAEPT